MNSTAIVETLQAHGPLSRAQLQEATGLSAATINRLVATLMREGAVVRTGVSSSRGGRPSHLLEYAGHGRAVAVVSVQRRTIRGALVNFEREVMCVQTQPWPAVDAAGAFDPAIVIDVLRALIQRSAETGVHCEGVGVAVPGYVDVASGQVIQAADLGWHDMPLGQVVADSLSLPCWVDNDANAIALGEYTRGRGRGREDLVAIEYGSGIGAGIISGGKLRRGRTFRAGEIGFLLTDRSALTRTYPEHGYLESHMGSEAMEERAAHAGWTPGGGPVLPWFTNRASRGDLDSRETLARFWDLLAMAVGSLCCVLDTELVLFSGDLTAHALDVVGEMRARLDGRLPRSPEFGHIELGEDAPILGIGEQLIRRVEGFAYVTR